MTQRRIVVLDASAVLAVFQRELGWEQSASRLPGSKISAVNWSEVVQKNLVRGVALAETQAWGLAAGLQITDFDRDLAEDVAVLYAVCAPAGISLADRACLALAKRDGLPALTADGAWSRVDTGVEVVQFR